MRFEYLCWRTKDFSFSTAFALGILFNQSAYADSFCGYDAGLIGTKAVGYVAPYSVKAITIDPETYDCFVLTYDEIPASEAEVVASSKSNSYSCDEFIHMPSPYVDSFKGNENNPEGFPIASSDYFAFLVFEVEDNLAQISLRTGKKKWIKTDRARSSFPYIYRGEGVPAAIGNPIPTQSGVYSAPRYNAPDPIKESFRRPFSEYIFEGDKQLAFFQHPFFQHLANEGKLKIEEGKIAEFANDLGSGFEVSYNIEEIIKDTEGREWLKASQKFSQTIHLYNWDDSVLAEGENHSEVISGSIRTVYFPYREPSGTITMVMVDGEYCD